MKKGVDIMKPKYMIGFFSALAVLVCFLSAGYRISYNNVLERQAVLEKSTADTRSIEAEISSADEKDPDDASGYRLKELHGFVAVYLDDGTTIYELTDIKLSDLPEEVRQEIASGKYVASEKELYGFLENYSS